MVTIFTEGILNFELTVGTDDHLNAFSFLISRSPHGFSDTDMCSMLQQLRRESENMCGHRGLLPNSEHQTFCFLAPLQLR